MMFSRGVLYSICIPPGDGIKKEVLFRYFVANVLLQRFAGDHEFGPRNG